MFIMAVVQYIKVGDLTVQPFSSPTFDDMPIMESPKIDYQLPAGIETGYASVLGKEEERTLTRDSTARFAGKLLVLEITPSPAYMTRPRLDCVPFPTCPCRIRESSGGRRSETNDWREARGDCCQVNQKHA
jgi:hypothetical protein